MRWFYGVLTIYVLSRNMEKKIYQNFYLKTFSFWWWNFQYIWNLEYCSTVWSLSASQAKHEIEIVQVRAARYATNRYGNTSSVIDMLEVDFTRASYTKKLRQYASSSFQGLFLSGIPCQLQLMLLTWYLSSRSSPSTVFILIQLGTKLQVGPNNGLELGRVA